MGEKQADDILQKYPHAGAYLEKTLQQEAEEKIANNQRLLSEVDGKIQEYNTAVIEINSCL
jgi:hypothetical protein